MVPTNVVFHDSYEIIYNRLCLLSLFHQPNYSIISHHMASKAPRVYTAYTDQIPGQLSYQNIKLANFIELELTDLCDTLHQIPPENFHNSVKDCLSRSYNAFHEMKKLYNDLGMNFLYAQTKKLISGYSILFVFLQERLESLATANYKQATLIEQLQERKARHTNGLKSQIEQEVKDSIQNIQSNKEDKQIKVYKKLKGVHLFNESYARHIDYDKEEFQRLREDLKNKENKQIRSTKQEEQARLRKEIQEECDDLSHISVDGEELYLFLNRQKCSSQEIRSISLGEELEKIATFFKQSQNEALEFLRKSKTQGSFHQLTEGFNIAVDEYKKCKLVQLESIQKRLGDVLDQIRKKSELIEQSLLAKQREIDEIKNRMSENIKNTAESSCQTYYDFDEELKIMYRKIVGLELENDELKDYIRKNVEEDKKEKDILVGQIVSKQMEVRHVRESLESRNEYVSKIERKVRVLVDTMKRKQIQDPVTYFTNMNDSMKKIFIEELKEQGFFNSRKQQDGNRVRLTKHSNRPFTNQDEEPHFQPFADKPNMYEEERSVNNSYSKRKQSSLVRRNSRQESTKMNGTEIERELRRSKRSENSFIHNHHAEDTSGARNALATTPKSNLYAKDLPSSKVISKKMINSRTPYELYTGQEKIRVFDLPSSPTLNDLKKIQSRQSKVRTGRKGINESEVNDKEQEESVSSESEIQSIKEGQQASKGENRKRKAESLEKRLKKTVKGSIKQSPSDTKVDVSSSDLEDGGNEQRESKQERKERKREGRERRHRNALNISPSPSARNKGKSTSINETIQSQEDEEAQTLNCIQAQDKRQQFNRNSQSPHNREQIEPSKKTNREKQIQFEKMKQEVWRSLNSNAQARLEGQSPLEGQQEQEQDNRLSENSFRNKKSKGDRIRQQYFQGESGSLGQIQKASQICHQFSIVILNGQAGTQFGRLSFDIRKSGALDELKNQNLTRKKIQAKSKGVQRETQKNFMSLQKERKGDHQMNTTVKAGLKQPNALINFGDKNPIKTESSFRNKKKVERINTKEYMDSGLSGWDNKFRDIVGDSEHSRPSERMRPFMSKHSDNRSQLNLANEFLNYELEEQEIRRAVEKSKSSQEFKGRVLNLHKKRCGNKCSHLERFLQVFTKYKNLLKGLKRLPIKLHVQNLHMPMELEEESGMKKVNLPAIRG